MTPQTPSLYEVFLNKSPQEFPGNFLLIYIFHVSDMFQHMNIKHFLEPLPLYLIFIMDHLFWY